MQVVQLLKGKLIKKSLIESCKFPLNVYSKSGKSKDLVKNLFPRPVMLYKPT